MDPIRKDRSRGVVMIAVIMGILILTVVAFTALMTSRNQMKLSSDFVGKSSCYYLAEEGLNKTLSYFVNPPSQATNPGDYALYHYNNFAPYKGKVTCNSEKKVVTLDANADLNSIKCHYYTQTYGQKEINVMVQRRPDHCKNGKLLTGTQTQCSEVGDTTDARVFLVNSICSDPDGTQEIMQGVIMVPMVRTVRVDSVSGNLAAETVVSPHRSPYLAAVVRGGTHVSSNLSGYDPPQTPVTQGIEVGKESAVPPVPPSVVPPYYPTVTVGLTVSSSTTTVNQSSSTTTVARSSSTTTVEEEPTITIVLPRTTTYRSSTTTVGQSSSSSTTLRTTTYRTTTYKVID